MDAYTLPVVERIIPERFRNLMNGFHLKQSALTLFASFGGRMDSFVLNAKTPKGGNFPQN
jgi:hypothetical protein